MDGNTAGIYHRSVKQWQEAMEKTTQYASRAKPPVPVDIIKQVVSGFPSNNEGWILRSAVLLIAYGGYRQSELMPPTPKTFNSEKHLTRKDVYLTENSVKISIKHGKNYSKYNQGRVSEFKKNENPEYCVVSALQKLFTMQPTISPEDALFTFPLDNSPVPLTYLRKNWESAIKALGQDPKVFSLHGIRKTTMTVAYHEGVPELDIRSYGAWSSNSHRVYIASRADLAVNAAVSKYYK